MNDKRKTIDQDGIDLDRVRLFFEEITKHVNAGRELLPKGPDGTPNPFVAHDSSTHTIKQVRL